MTRTLKSLHTDPLTPKLATIACPVLLVVGEKDPMGSRASELIADALPAGAATLEVIPACGHWIHVEAADRVLVALDAWLASATALERERAGGEEPTGDTGEAGGTGGTGGTRKQEREER